MFRLIRFAFLLAVLAVGALAVDPHWSESTRTLTLRVRSANELLEVVGAQARALGQRVLDARNDRDPESGRTARATGEAATADVAAGPIRRDEAPIERITNEERSRLDRLIEEKTRGE